MIKQIEKDMQPLGCDDLKDIIFVGSESKPEWLPELFKLPVPLKLDNEFGGLILRKGDKACDLINKEIQDRKESFKADIALLKRDVELYSQGKGEECRPHFDPTDGICLNLSKTVWQRVPRVCSDTFSCHTVSLFLALCKEEYVECDPVFRDDIKDFGVSSLPVIQWDSSINRFNIDNHFEWPLMENEDPINLKLVKGVEITSYYYQENGKRRIALLEQVLANFDKFCDVMGYVLKSYFLIRMQEDCYNARHVNQSKDWEISPHGLDLLGLKIEQLFDKVVQSFRGLSDCTYKYKELPEEYKLA